MCFRKNPGQNLITIRSITSVVREKEIEWQVSLNCFCLQKNDLKRKEKILKELERKYEIEKNKTSKLEENVKTTEEDLKVTKKVSLSKI